jgi:hypothetical protein
LKRTIDRKNVVMKKKNNFLGRCVMVYKEKKTIIRAGCHWSWHFYQRIVFACTALAIGICSWFVPFFFWQGDGEVEDVSWPLCWTDSVSFSRKPDRVGILCLSPTNSFFVWAPNGPKSHSQRVQLNCASC